MTIITAEAIEAVMADVEQEAPPITVEQARAVARLLTGSPRPRPVEETGAAGVCVRPTGACRR